MTSPPSDLTTLDARTIAWLIAVPLLTGTLVFLLAYSAPTLLPPIFAGFVGALLGRLLHRLRVGLRSRLVHLLRGQGESLLAVINDVLDFSKVESGRVLDEIAGGRDVIEGQMALNSGCNMFGCAFGTGPPSA